MVIMFVHSPEFTVYRLDRTFNNNIGSLGPRSNYSTNQLKCDGGARGGLLKHWKPVATWNHSPTSAAPDHIGQLINNENTSPATVTVCVSDATRITAPNPGQTLCKQLKLIESNQAVRSTELEAQCTVQSARATIDALGLVIFWFRGKRSRVRVVCRYITEPKL